jgi:phage gp36-like protein
MTYATTAGLDARFGAKEMLEISDRNRDGITDVGVLSVAIYAIDSRINSIIGVRYAVPVIPAPEALMEAADNLVRWELHDDKETPRIKAGYDHAMKYLRDIASGAIALIGADGLPVTPITNASITYGVAAGGAARRITAEVQAAMP